MKVRKTKQKKGATTLITSNSHQKHPPTMMTITPSISISISSPDKNLVRLQSLECPGAPMKKERRSVLEFPMKRKREAESDDEFEMSDINVISEKPSAMKKLNFEGY